MTRAHEVPNEVTVFGFVRPEGQTLRLLVRAPLKSMQDIDVPLQSNGFLDFTRMESAERHAAQVWIRDFVHLYENGAELPLANIASTRTSLPSDRSFEAYETALANLLTGPKLDNSTEIYWDNGMLDVLFEVHDETEIERALRHGAKIIGVNNRDLSTFTTDLSLSERLIREIPRGVIAVSESGIVTAEDGARVHAAGARAVLVGESLMKAADPGELIAALHGA